MGCARPLLALVTGGASVLIWFFKPTGEVVVQKADDMRQTVAGRAAKLLRGDAPTTPEDASEA
jgi:hypothetical protein